jgi:NADPH:quinone reductase-like Zn-dependent oxidoreductase
MYAIGLNNYGGPEVLRRVELPDPHPQPGQVRIRVRSAGVNPVDVMVRDGSLKLWFASAEPPFVPGMDIAGIIDEVGAEVDPVLNIELGQQVVGLVDNFESYGGYSEYVCLPAESVIPVPAGLSFPAAASFLMNALTARNALDALRLPSGAIILVTGAAGSVGAYTVALAAAQGLHVVALASEKDQDFLRAVGASTFISRDSDVIQQVRAVFPSGVDAIVDTAGLFENIAPALRDGQSLVILRPMEHAPLERGIRTLFVNVRERSTDNAAMKDIGNRIARGLLPVRVAEIFPADQAPAAHRRLAQGSLGGRIILDFDAH